MMHVLTWYTEPDREAGRHLTVEFQRAPARLWLAAGARRALRVRARRGRQWTMVL